VTLTIYDEWMGSDVADVTANFEDGSWFVTGYPGRAMDRNQAITAMTLAEERAKPDPDQVLISALESEL
jgi:hypothetical protein